MRHIIAIFLLSVIFNSCSRDEDIKRQDDPLITKMMSNIFYDGFGLYSGGIIHFDYDTKKRLIKQTGIDLEYEPGYSYFAGGVYTSLVYNGNNVVVENFSSSNDFPLSGSEKNLQYYTLNSSQQIVTKEIPSIYNNYWDRKQTFTYTNGKISEIKTTYPNMPYDPESPPSPTNPLNYILTSSEKFYYDSNGNLTKAEFFEQRNGINEGQRFIQTFEDYDNSPNPFKRFYLLDGYFFYRSLSNNNYRKQTIERYIGNYPAYLGEHSWKFPYDANGNIILYY
jgi:hypothetical protein